MAVGSTVVGTRIDAAGGRGEAGKCSLRACAAELGLTAAVASALRISKRSFLCLWHEDPFCIAPVACTYASWLEQKSRQEGNLTLLSSRRVSLGSSSLHQAALLI